MITAVVPSPPSDSIVRHTDRLPVSRIPRPDAGDMYAVATDTGPPSGSLVRRQSLPRPAAACDASLSGDGDADGLRHGLPIHFSFGDRGSAKGGARKKERVYRYCSFTLLLALLVCTSAVYMLLKAHHRQGQQLAHHHAGWTATYEELQAKHNELKDHREALTRKGAELQSKHAQLAGASEQLQLFHNALQHKEATLAQLLEERQALQESVRSLMAAAHAQAEAARHEGGGAAELAAVQGEVESLRASLTRCVRVASAVHRFHASARSQQCRVCTVCVQMLRGPDRCGVIAECGAAAPAAPAAGWRGSGAAAWWWPLGQRPGALRRLGCRLGQRRVAGAPRVAASGGPCCLM